MELFGTILDHKGPFWTLWDHMGTWGTIRDHKSPYRTIPDHRDHSCLKVAKCEYVSEFQIQRVAHTTKNGRYIELLNNFNKFCFCIKLCPLAEFQFCLDQRKKDLALTSFLNVNARGVKNCYPLKFLSYTKIFQLRSYCNQSLTLKTMPCYKL